MPEGERGLSAAEAAARLARDGPNRLPPPAHKSVGAATLAVLQQPMVGLLVACAALYALLGNPFDSLVLAGSIVVVAAISVYQELRTQRVLEALHELSSPRSTVVRDGIARRVASQELVVGDRLLVREGDRLAADACLVASHGLRIDESMLTGESVPVDKDAGAAADDERRLHAGTLTVQGDGVATVVATGTHTMLGRIGGSLAALAPRESRMQQELKRVVRTVALVALATCVVASAVFAWRDGSWTSGLLVGLTLAMAIVPEEFAVVWTVLLALGAWRLAKAQVLTRQPQAIEALGAITVLCVDKTGTLTRNRMELAALHDGRTGLRRDPRSPLPGEWQPLVQAALRASIAGGIEPMDRALERAAPGLAGAGALQLVAREGLVPGQPYLRQHWRDAAGARDHLAAKGAPEAVLALCSDPPERLRALAAQAEAWAAEGMRVLAVAAASLPAGGDAARAPLAALGLVAFEDPLRDDVAEAMRVCRDAGVRVVMITGDAPATALAIARQAGLVEDGDAGQVLTGAAIEAMNEARFELAVRAVRVFARVTPAQKLRIVQALQRRGEVVAMTGDGVNDGPALRAADVGVAMGERGSDVAREAAGIVLLDDRFAALVDAVRAGRRIFANLQKAMAYLFAVHVPIVGLSLLPLAGGPVLLLPLHVVLLELIIDPACSLVFEAEPARADTMRVPPRPAGAPLFDLRAIARALAVGGVALAAVAAVQVAGQVAGLADDALRLAGLATIVAGNLLMLQWFRRGFGSAPAANRAFDALLLAVCAVGALLLAVAPIGAAFGLPAPAPPAFAAALALPAAWALWRLGRRA